MVSCEEVGGLSVLCRGCKVRVYSWIGRKTMHRTMTPRTEKVPHATSIGYSTK